MNDCSCFSWEAGQILGRKLMLSLVADFQQNKSLALNPQFVHGFRCILRDSSLDKVLTIDFLSSYFQCFMDLLYKELVS